MKSIHEIHEKLKVLRLLDKNFEVFGASSHKYQFNPPLPIKTLNRLEAQFEIRLPHDYKSFLTEIGNGGAGPYYGIHPFYVVKPSEKSMDTLNNFELLKFDFPHKTAWNWPAKVFAKFDEIIGGQDGELEDFFSSVFDKQYYQDNLKQGSMYISEYGCALKFLLVITGRERGKIWFDQRADREGIHPVTDQQGNHLDFSDWYMQWLDDTIKKIKK